MNCRIFLIFLLSVFGTMIYAQNTEKEVVERVIYIPYKQLEKLMDKTESGIYLPYEDYQSLLRQVETLGQRPSQQPPVVLISKVHYEAEVEEQFVKVSADCTLNILKEGWHGVGLDFSQIAVHEATLDGKPALLHWKDNRYQLVLNGQKVGEHRLKIDFYCPVQKLSGGKYAVNFRVPRAPIARFHLKYPKQEKVPGVEIYPSLQTTRVDSEKFVEWHALLGNTDSIRVNWQTQVEQKLEIKKIMHAENLQLLEIQEDAYLLYGQIRYNIVQGEVKEIKVKIPQDYSISKIKLLRGAEVEKFSGPDRNTGEITVHLKEKVINKGEEQPELELYIKLKNKVAKLKTEFHVPTIQVLDVDSEKGFYGMTVNQFYTLKEAPGKKDIIQIDTSDLPPYMQERNNSQFAYKYFKQNFDLAVELEKIKLEYEVYANAYGYLDKTSYKLSAHFNFNIKKARIFRARIELPEGMTFSEAHAYDLAARSEYGYENLIKDPKPYDKGELLFTADFKHGEQLDKGEIAKELAAAFAERKKLSDKAMVKIKEIGKKWYVEDGDNKYTIEKNTAGLNIFRGGQFLELIFQKGIHSKKLVVRVSMEKELPAKEEVRKLNLPVFRVREAKREIGNIGLQVHKNYRLTTDDKALQNINPIDTGKLYARGDKPHRNNKINLGFKFEHNSSTGEETITGEFSMEKRKPLVTAKVYDYVTIDDNVIKHEFHLFYDIKYTGNREFSFTLPKDIAKEVEESHVFDSHNPTRIQQKKKTAKDDVVLYEITTSQDITGSYLLRVDYTHKLRTLDTPQILDSFELITKQTKQEDGFIVIKKNNNLSLTVVGLEKLNEIGVKDPKYKGQKENVFKIFKYNDHGYQLRMQLQKLQFEPVLNTVINRLHISTAVNKDFTTNNEAVILLLNNRRDTLEFELPEGVEGLPTAKWLTRIPGNSNRKYKPSELKPYLRTLPLIKATKQKENGRKKWQVNIANHVPKNAPFFIVIHYGLRVNEGEMGMSGNFALQSITFPGVPITSFTWHLGLPNEYLYTWFDSNMSRDTSKQPVDYGIWSVIDPLASKRSIDTTHIKEVAETGVVPIYDIAGKEFKFSRLRGNGRISICYTSPSWMYTQELAIFVLICLFITFLPKFYQISRLSLVTACFIASLFLSSFNWQGYQHFYLPALYASLFSGAGFLGVFWLQGMSEWGPKPHNLVRTREKDQVKAEEKKVESDNPSSENQDSGNQEQNNEE